MITSPRLFSILYFLHFERSSAIEIPGVSSIISCDFAMLSAPSMSLPQSLESRRPLRILSASTVDSRLSIRLTSCTLDISRLNTAVVMPCLIATFSATFKTNAVLPIDGRAATSTKSDGCKPDKYVSRSLNPVGTPVTAPLFLAAMEILSSASNTTLSIGIYSCPPLFFTSSKIRFSVSARISSVLSLPS